MRSFNDTYGPVLTHLSASIQAAAHNDSAQPMPQLWLAKRAGYRIGQAFVQAEVAYDALSDAHRMAIAADRAIASSETLLDEMLTGIGLNGL